MPSWNDLLAELVAQPNDAAKAQWTTARLQGALADVGAQRGGRNVILYGSAAAGDFIPQKSDYNLLIALHKIAPEDLRNAHACVREWRRVLRPGGVQLHGIESDRAPYEGLSPAALAAAVAGDVARGQRDHPLLREPAGSGGHHHGPG